MFTYEKLWQRVRESNPFSEFRELAQLQHKLAAISALTALGENGHFVRIAQNYAVPVSETGWYPFPEAIRSKKGQVVRERETSTVNWKRIQIANSGTEANLGRISES